MDRALKSLLPALVVAEVVLVRAGVLDLSTAIGVVVAIELALLLVASRQILVAVRRYRRDRKTGLDAWAALEDGLAVFFPRRVARIVALEPRLWVCLGKWALRRHRLEVGEFAYHKRSIVGVMLVVVLFTTPVELLFFELVVPWEWLRVLLLVLAAYALFWAFAFYASLVVLPHRLERDGISVHYGAWASGRLPYAAIAEVALERRRSPGTGDGLKLSPKEGAAYLAVSGRTDVTLRLRESWHLEAMLGPTAPVSVVYLAADDPERLVRELAERLVARGGESMGADRGGGG